MGELLSWLKAHVERLAAGRLRMISPGERHLTVFISSVMAPELKAARKRAATAFRRAPLITSWTFEYTPASSENAQQGYLRHVREADFVVWLVGSVTTAAVQSEVREALSNRRRLLIVKLPAQGRDEMTERLLAEVGFRAKWFEVADESDLEAVLRLSLSDEIIRAVRAMQGPPKLEALQDALRASQARCIARWVVLGVSPEQAEELLRDPSVGDTQAKDSSDSQFVLLEGKLGSGKTLVAERLYQRAIEQMTADLGRPLPVLLNATTVTSLSDSARSALLEVGDPYVQGAYIVVDGLDEVPLSKAWEILTEARQLVDSWPITKVILTTRPGLPPSEIYTVVHMRELSEEQALALVGRVAGRTLRSAYGWPASVREAVK